MLEYAKALKQNRSRPKTSPTSPRVQRRPSTAIAADPAEPPPEKNPTAVSLVRLGGLRAGRPGPEVLTAEQRSETAREAAPERRLRIGGGQKG